MQAEALVLRPASGALEDGCTSSWPLFIQLQIRRFVVFQILYVLPCNSFCDQMALINHEAISTKYYASLSAVILHKRSIFYAVF
jgi:hypothetical protein